MPTVFFSREEVERFSHLYHTEKGGLPWLESRKGRPLYLFGAGDHGSFARAELYGRGIAVTGFLDNNPALSGKHIYGLPVFQPDDPDVAAANPVVILTTYDQRVTFSVRNQCLAMGYEHVYWWDAGIGVLPRCDAASLEQDPHVQAAFALWDDQKSADIFRARVRFLASRDWRDLPPIEIGQYFLPFIPAEYYRSFVDGGAFDGDTLTEFISRFGTDFDNYYAFEADSGNFHELRSSLIDDPRIQCFEAALFDKNMSIPFHHGHHEGSKPMEGYDTLAQAVTLDQVLAGQQASFIKLDIEGSEPEALNGAKTIIAAQRPALAVCVYHQAEHLWTIPLWIKRHAVDYRLFLRNHEHYDAVCYAIPN